MSIEAWRWWRVNPDGLLESLFLGTKWESPVLTAEFPVLEVYHAKVLEVVKDESSWSRDYNLCEILEKPNIWGGKAVPMLLPDLKVRPVGAVVEAPCASGIHALRELEPLSEAMLWIGQGSPYVGGAVRLFGHIVEHERGWRAEKALVSGPLVLYKDDEALTKRIATRYDCEVTCTKESPYGPGEDDPRIR